MVLRLKPGDRPDDPKMTICQHINALNPEADVVWMTYDDWNKDPISLYHDPNAFPDEIKSLIPKWREYAMKADKEDGVFFFPIKWASVEIYYHDEKYYIGTEILSGIGDEYTKDWIFERIERRMEEDLYDLGADYVRYRGMID